MNKNKMSTWRKILRWGAIVGIAGMVIGVIALVLGLLLMPAGDDGKPAPQSTSSGKNREEGSKPRNPMVVDPDGTVGKVQLDASGLMPMVASKDPRAAAAAAARVLWSVDSSKVEFGEDFRRAALERVMHPTKEYVGVGSQWLVNDPIAGKQYTGAELAERAPDTIRDLSYSPNGWWWRFGDDSEYEALRVQNAVARSNAIAVYDAAQVDKLVDGASWTELSPNNEVNITKKGASFGLYWVRVETTITANGESGKVRNPTALAIYCDPPEEGGICGVSALVSGYPQAWQHQ